VESDSQSAIRLGEKCRFCGVETFIVRRRPLSCRKTGRALHDEHDEAEMFGQCGAMNHNKAIERG
jgi:hypothetical protein